MCKNILLRPFPISVMKDSETMFLLCWFSHWAHPCLLSAINFLQHKVKAQAIGHKTGLMVPCQASSSALVHVRCAVPDLKGTLTQDTACSVPSVFIHQPVCGFP